MTREFLFEVLDFKIEIPLRLLDLCKGPPRFPFERVGYDFGLLRPGAFL